MEFGVSLVSRLSQIGIKELFTQQADLWNILAPERQKPPFLCVSEIMHKAFIDVNELGTEAAARYLCYRLRQCAHAEAAF